MSSWRRASFRWVLVAVMVAFTATVLLVQNIPLASHLRGVERDRIVTGLQRDAFTIAGQAEDVLGGGDPAGLNEVTSVVSEYSTATGARVVVTDAAGIAVVTSDGTDLGQDYTNRPEIAAALSGEAVAGQRPSDSAGEDLLYVAVPVRSGADILGTVRITYPAAEVDQAVDERVRGLLVVALITLVAAAFIAVLIARLVTEPLSRLRQTSEAIAGGDLGARVDPQAIGELGDVAQSFNTMAQRVETVVAAQRNFAGDASHQLRSPLTALRMRIETAQELADRDPEASAQALEQMAGDVERMQRLVEGLLALARADRGDQEREQVDVAVAVRQRVSDWEALAAERGVSITTDTADAAGSWLVWSVSDGVGQVLDNYLDNALEAAPPDSELHVGLKRAGDWIEVSVEDAGAGLSSAERAHAFDRFWRGTSERTGSGLGLAIVRSLADASGAEVELQQARRSATGTCAVSRWRPAG